MSSDKLTLDRLVSYIVEIVGEGTADEEAQQSPENDNAGNLNSISRLKVLPTNLLEIFEPYLQNLYKLNVAKKLVEHKTEHNISLYSSVLAAIKKDYLDIPDKEHGIWIKKFMESAAGSLTTDNLYTELGYKKMIRSEKELLAEIKNCTNSDPVLFYISDYLFVNIFVLDVDKGSLRLYYTEEAFDEYKMNLLLHYKNGEYEPLFYNNNRLHKSDTDLISVIINFYRNKLSVIPMRKKDAKAFKIGKRDLTKFITGGGYYYTGQDQPKLQRKKKNDDPPKEAEVEEAEVEEAEVEEAEVEEAVAEEAVENNEKLNKHDNSYNEIDCSDEEIPDDLHTDGGYDEDDDLEVAKKAKKKASSIFLKKEKAKKQKKRVDDSDDSDSDSSSDSSSSESSSSESTKKQSADLEEESDDTDTIHLNGGAHSQPTTDMTLAELKDICALYDVDPVTGKTKTGKDKYKKKADICTELLEAIEKSKNKKPVKKVTTKKTIGKKLEKTSKKNKKNSS